MGSSTKVFKFFLNKSRNINTKIVNKDINCLLNINNPNIIKNKIDLKFNSLKLENLFKLKINTAKIKLTIPSNINESINKYVIQSLFKTIDKYKIETDILLFNPFVESIINNKKKNRNIFEFNLTN
tara:strand:- start:77 stop:454 length:378 start_codon:yes stop_codon:yes gene_type:complete